MICVSVTAATTEEAIAAVRRAAGEADMVELRIDFMEEFDLRRLLADRPCPAIVTNRPVREGGKWKGSEEERLAVLQQAVELGADYVDIELDSFDKIKRSGDTKLIASYHNFEETPSNLDEIITRLGQTGCDVVKFSVKANDIRDNLSVFRALRSQKKPTIGLAMGARGQISRVLAGKFGGFLTFAAMADGSSSAEGQMTAAEMRDIYNCDTLGEQTSIFGIIGNPVAHSLSPALHNASFRDIGFDAIYVPFLVDDVMAFVEAYKEIGVKGYSVTIPHKQAIIPCLNEIDPIAKKIGAVNTVVNEDGRLKGYNTDWCAALAGIEEAVTRGGGVVRGASAAIVGARGVARAIAFGLKEKGAEITIFNRTHEKAEELVGEVGCACKPMDELEEKETEILVNATSVGMHPNTDASIVPGKMLRQGMVVFDSVYNPERTKLICEAESAGCITVTGVDMFVRQAAAQFELWTGQPAPVERMTKIVRQRLP